jgi:hypothetical protein
MARGGPTLDGSGSFEAFEVSCVFPCAFRPLRFGWPLSLTWATEEGEVKGILTFTGRRRFRYPRLTLYSDRTRELDLDIDVTGVML